MHKVQQSLYRKINITLINYDPELFSHYYWHDSAKKLRYSADVLNEKLTELLNHDINIDGIIESKNNQLAIFESYMMLTGFALENLIKGVFIKTYHASGKQITDFDQLKKVWNANGHDTKQIAKNCNFSLTDKELDLLDRYSEFSIWAGRYPIPTKPETYHTVFKHRKLQSKKGDRLLIENIFRKAELVLRETAD